MSGSGLNRFLAMHNEGSPVERKQSGRGQVAREGEPNPETPGTRIMIGASKSKPGDALATFLAMDDMGSPYEAQRRGMTQAEAEGVEGEILSRDGRAAYQGDLDELHTKLVGYFEEAERNSDGARRAAERDRDYFDDKQWTAKEMEALRKRGQPDLTINYVKRKVELLSGLERRSRTDPKAFPRTPTEEDRADAATQSLRYVADATHFGQVRSDVYQNMLIEGFGGCEIGLEDDGKGGAEITLKHVPWDRLFHDPHSRRADFSDACYLGIVIWMDRDQLLELFPNADGVVEETFAPSSGTYEDKPGHVAWQDNQRKRSRIVQVHWLEGGDWWGATISRAGFLSEPQRSAFKDHRGRSTCPLRLRSAYVDRENNRYGAVRTLIGLQDDINKRRSKALHLLNARGIIAEKGAVADIDRARREMARPDAYVEVNPGFRFDVVPAADFVTGQFQLLQHATQEMQASGPNASMAGNDPRDLSGRAIMAQQAGGAAQNEPLADALRQWSREVYEVVWQAIREFWTGEKWLRVTDDMGKLQWVGLNHRVTLQEELAKMPEEQRAMAMQRMMLQPGDPRLMQVIRIENEVSDLEVDITIEEGPDSPSMQAEQFQQLTQLAGALPPGTIPPDVIIAASSLRNKDQLLDMLKQQREAQAQQQQAQAPIAQAHAVAEVRQKDAQAQANEALAAERRAKAVHQVAQTHRTAAESPAVPVGPVGPDGQPILPGQVRVAYPAPAQEMGAPLQ